MRDFAPCTHEAMSSPTLLSHVTDIGMSNGTINSVQVAVRDVSGQGRAHMCEGDLERRPV
jgi:hypothetical protein